jgi:DeoR family transcriptional regulator, suf operon transcriptional repressor
LLDLLRRRGPLRIEELTVAAKVTATAVRQRLSRLMESGLVERSVCNSHRGRPSHRYGLTTKGERGPGDNFADLAVVLWREIRAIKDPEVRRGLYQRLASGMADQMRAEVVGETPDERMRSVAAVFARRKVSLAVEDSAAHRRTEAARTGGDADALTVTAPNREFVPLPILTALACPYPELAEEDAGICAVERMMFAELIGTNVRLAECRLSGDHFCRFAMN